MNFFYSDPHFRHYNVILYSNRPFLYSVNGSDIFFENKLVKSCNNEKEAEIEARKLSLTLMEETLIKNWNNKVSPEDTVYVGGDFAFSGIEVVPGILKRLNGKKILIEGNHDKSKESMLKMGFDEVHESLSLKIGSHEVILNHYPYVDVEFNHIAKHRPNIIKINTKGSELPEVPKNFDYLESKEFLLKNYSRPIDFNIDSKKNYFNYLKRAISTHIGTRLINEGKILIHGHTHSKVKRFANMINISVEAHNYEPVSESEILTLINEYYEEISEYSVTEENCDNAVYSYYSKINLPEHKKLNEIISTFKRIKKSRTDERFKYTCAPPRDYSKRWYEVNVEHNTFIPKNKLQIGAFYKGNCRNGDLAYWDGRVFLYYRTKFGSTFISSSDAIEDDQGFDLFVPYYLVELDEETAVKFRQDVEKWMKDRPNHYPQDKPK